MASRRGRGEGTVFEISPGRWRADVSLGTAPSGKRIRKVVYGATKREAQERMRKLQGDADNGRISDADGLTAAQYLKRWLEMVKPSLKPATFERYEGLAEHLIPHLGTMKLGKFQPIHVEHSLAELAKAEGISTWTRRKCGGMLSTALKHAVKLKLIPSNPAADVKLARPKAREMSVMTVEQSRVFLRAAARHRLHALFSLALATGLRQGEILGLQWADFDFEAGTVAVRRTLSYRKGQFVLGAPKSAASRRTVQVPPFCLKVLKEHRAAMVKEGRGASPTFCTKVGTYIEKNNLAKQIYTPMLKRARALAVEEGLEPIAAGFRFHDLRHTHASLLISAGESLKAVSRRLGHGSVAVTLSTYAHLMPNDDAKLAERSDAIFGG
jgi:integrase